ncbi:ligand-gated sodium channel [Desmophyllum pertusum]|uniref:Ligand-gated sodium channel n=1 Tax=Desmophyllum pertusum TaxID=174260 RepID=A0A9W9YKG3_9CNID|nr:ligand-gated sodium channel [Desmophyllum pertusum]
METVFTFNGGRMIKGRSKHPLRRTALEHLEEVIKRVDPFNNGSCRKSDTEHKNDIYSREECMRSCLAKIQIKQCGCTEARITNNDGYVCKHHQEARRSTNFLQVKVFFDRLNYQEVQEQLSYKGINLIADIGGQLGLWIGVSVLTCCEVVELAMLLIQSVFKRVTTKASRVEVRE